MKLKSPILLNTLGQQFGLEVKSSDQDKMVLGINEINRVGIGDICFVDFEKYYKMTLESEASFVLVPEEMSAPDDKVLLVHSHPFEVYNQMAREMYAANAAVTEESKIDSSARIHKTAVIGQHVTIGAHSIIESYVVVGDGTHVGANVKIESGTIVGGDAFYFHKSKAGVLTKWFSCGNVEIGNDVSIGSLCTINRGVSSTTKIGHGSKLDCNIQIGHGVEIGKHCLIAAQVGISGKTILGDYVSIFGQVGITQNIRIGNRVKVLAQSGVNDDIPDGETWFGSPAIPARQKMKEIFFLRQKGKE